MIRGRKYPCPTAKDAYVKVLRTLADAVPSFLERLARHPAATRRNGCYIGRTLDELYASDRRARAQHGKLPGGWLVATKLSNDQKRRFIDVAIEVAGWSHKDIVLPF